MNSFIFPSPISFKGQLGNFTNANNTDHNTFWGNACAPNAVAGTAQYNTGFGTNALTSLTTGTGNSGFGNSVLHNLTTGSNNTAFNTNSLFLMTASSNNSAFGLQAGKGLNPTGTIGSGNTIIGSNAGATLNTSSVINCTFIGQLSNNPSNIPISCTSLGQNTSAVSFTQATTIGVNATATANNQIIFGTSTEFVVCAGTSTTNGALQVKSSILNKAAQTTAGAATFTQVQSGHSWKRILAYCNNLTGAQSYTFPVAFTNIPQIVSTNGPSSTVVTALSTSAMTITGSSTTGFVILEGY